MLVLTNIYSLEMTLQTEQLAPEWLVFCAVYAKNFDIAKSCEKANLPIKYVRDNLDHPVIQKQIARHVKTVCDKAEVDKVYILRQLVDLLEADMTEGMNEYGQWLPIHQWTDRLRKKLVVLECDSVTGTPTKVKFESTLSIIDRLGKHVEVGAFEERSRVVHDVSDLAVAIEESRKRATGHLIEGEVINDTTT